MKNDKFQEHLSRPGIIDAKARYRAAARRLRNTTLNWLTQNTVTNAVLSLSLSVHESQFPFLSYSIKFKMSEADIKEKSRYSKTATW